MTDEEMNEMIHGLTEKLLKGMNEFWHGKKNKESQDIFCINSNAVSLFFASLVHSMINETAPLKLKHEYIDRVCNGAKILVKTNSTP